MWKSLGAALLVAAWPAAALADGLPAGLEPAGRGIVRAVIDGGTFTLEDGRTVRLAALDVPRPTAPAANDRRPAAQARREMVAAQARDALSALLGGGEVALAVLQRPVDRYGRTLAHVVDRRDRWIQAEMVVRGFARVAVFADERAGLRELLALEAQARAERRGLWTLPEFRIVGADDALRFLDTFQLVEGRVRKVEQKGGRSFLNFGDDWRSDFTIVVPAAVRRQLASSGLDPAGYEGKMVRVRGWIKSRNGPSIELVQPEQIEVIE